MRYSNKYVSLVFLFVLVFAGGSCKKFLTVLPVNDVSDQVTIVDATSAETAVRGVYRSLAGGYAAAGGTGTGPASGCG